MPEITYLSISSQMRVMGKMYKRTIKEVEIALLQAECKLGHKIVTNNAMRILNGR
jgi:hypothetical protein